MKNLILAVVLSIILPLSAYSNDTRVVKNSAGEEIVIPAQVQRVVLIIGAFKQTTAMLGGGDKIIETMRSDEIFYRVFPDIKKNNKAKTFSLNVETLIDFGAEVVYGPTSYFFSDTQIKQLQDVGIAVVKIDAYSNPDELKKCVELIADILGGDAPKRAAKFNKYYDENVNRVQNITEKLTKKPRVMALNLDANAYSTVNDNDIGAMYMKIAGGINVAGEHKSGDKNIYMLVNTEQITIWNPDVIITNTVEGKRQILKDKALKFVDAVKNKKVYVVPDGVYLWSVRSTEGSLQPLWLAKIFHPELFVDINLEDETRYFYKEFYNYDLSNKEVREILHLDENIDI